MLLSTDVHMHGIISFIANERQTSDVFPYQKLKTETFRSILDILGAKYFMEIP